MYWRHKKAGSVLCLYFYNDDGNNREDKEEDEKNEKMEEDNEDNKEEEDKDVIQQCVGHTA